MTKLKSNLRRNISDDDLFQSRRSFIFAPGTRPELVPKAIQSGADIVCVELEDGVAPHDKESARNNVTGLFENHAHDKSVELVVRMNSLRCKYGLDDLTAFLEMEVPPTTIMLPKVECAEEVKLVDDLLSEKNLEVELHLIIETNLGLEASIDIALASTRTSALFFGGVDMAADLRCNGDWNSLLYARSKVVHAAATAKIDSLDVPYLDLEDEAGLRDQAVLARDLGFSGKGSIHPKQIPVINEVFTPSEAEIKYAEKVIKAFDAADSGLVVVDGKLIEKPVLREMKRKLSIMKRIR